MRRHPALTMPPHQQSAEDATEQPIEKQPIGNRPKGQRLETRLETRLATAAQQSETLTAHEPMNLAYVLSPWLR